MHDSFWNALAVEMLQLFDQMKVLKQQWAAWAGGQGILIVGHRNSGC